MILHLHKSQLWLHILSTWRTKQDDSSFDGFDWQLSQSAELFITFYSHTGKKNKTKNEHLKSAVAFHFLMSVESARLGSDQLLLARQSNASTTATESRCWLKGRNSEREKTSVCCRGQCGDCRPWLNREREKYVNVQGRFNTDGRI